MPMRTTSLPFCMPMHTTSLQFYLLFLFYREEEKCAYEIRHTCALNVQLSCWLYLACCSHVSYFESFKISILPSISFID